MPEPNSGLDATGLVRCGCALCAGLRPGTGGDGGGTAFAAAAALSPYYVSALLPPSRARWDGSTPGRPATVTYSFMTAAPSYADSQDRNGFAPMSEVQRAATRQALATWAEVANLSFVESADASTVMIRLGTNTQNGVSSGYAYLPGSSTAGDVYIANDYAENANPAVGSYGFLTLVHEIGHALGLKHPGNYNAGGGGSPGPYLPLGEDNALFSVMSYSRNPDLASNPVGPSVYDVAAIQYLYGANAAAHAGPDVYALAAGGSFHTLWDGGGVDAIDAGRQGEAVHIDLRPGTASFAGGKVAAVVALDTTIENATGGGGDDTLLGNAADNRLDGGGGSDVAIFAQAQAAYRVLRLPNGAYLVTGPEGRDVLVNVERAQFGAAAPVAVDGTVGGSFDALSYLASNPDLAAAFGADPMAAANHFVNAGLAEGRPTGGFDGLLYLASNPDVAAALGADPTAATLHYIRSGRAEGRATASFDAFTYLASNPDLASAFGPDPTAATAHYVSAGRREGRSTGGFDGLLYLASNPDLLRAFGTDTQAATRHYVGHGRNEGRPTRSFDALAYLAGNPDLAAAFGASDAAGVRHYVSNGWHEGRPTGGFDAWRYLAGNPDLIGALGADTAVATRHYIEHGRAENRALNGFNATRYLQRNADVAAALGSDQTAAVRHYVEHGYREHRNPGSNAAPVVTARNAAPMPYTLTPVTSLFGTTDGDGDRIQTYELRLTSAGNTLLRLNGATQYAPTLSVAAASLDSVTLYAGEAGGPADQLQVRAYDGFDWGGWTTVSVRVEPPADGAGNTMATARDVGALSAVAQNFSDWVGSGDTADYYRIQATRGQRLAALLFGLNGNASLDLYSAAGSRLGSGFNNALQSTVTATGIYYLRVSGYVSASYRLSLSATGGTASVPFPGAVDGVLAAPS